MQQGEQIVENGNSFVQPNPKCFTCYNYEEGPSLCTAMAQPHMCGDAIEGAYRPITNPIGTQLNDQLLTQVADELIEILGDESTPLKQASLTKSLMKKERKLITGFVWGELGNVGAVTPYFAKSVSTAIETSPEFSANVAKSLLKKRLQKEADAQLLAGGELMIRDGKVYQNKPEEIKKSLPVEPVKVEEKKEPFILTNVNVLR